jgi:hypothetical protein
VGNRFVPETDLPIINDLIDDQSISQFPLFEYLARSAIQALQAFISAALLSTASPAPKTR